MTFWLFLILLIGVCAIAVRFYLIPRARKLTKLEQAVLNDPTLDDSPLTQRDGKLLTVSHKIPGSSVYYDVTVRTVNVSAASARNPTPALLPAFVLVHGLGGQMQQFDDLVDFFSYYGDVLAMDLPGSGQAPMDLNLPAELYSTPSLVGLIKTVIDTSLGQDREVVLVGHSLGTAMTCLLAKLPDMTPRCKALVAICPPAPLAPSTLHAQKIAKYMPAWAFDMFRYSDRKDGLQSPSVRRMMGTAVDTDAQTQLKIRRRQLRWNLQVRTPVWLAMAAGVQLPSYADWASLKIPVCVIGAQNDAVTPPDAAQAIADCIREARDDNGVASVRSTIIPGAGHMCMVDRHETVCGIVNDFIVSCVDERLSLGWQLADIAKRDDKWSLKNEAKWRNVQSVSPVIGNSHFRAMKTLRQDDPDQNPVSVERTYTDITDIIDISRDHPPYAPSSFERIAYHKFPTISKIPPTRTQVHEFIALVDSICYTPDGTDLNRIVAVHCHYGFNRTGFLICAYMIERMHKPVRESVEDFKVARPPGIKHPHFVDELYVRYTL
ncbi:Alpha/Beta hydrolase protein [Lipomyces arxii]|uniref:Alpha/Beta hydrolase protein n=1 Tax=Lipomyces arxii TaxID=56418 RepID=UPI0034CF9F3F